LNGATPNSMTPIWVTLITGFLGSGKTTLLNSLLKSPLLGEAMVIVNEFGEIGIDSDLTVGSSENIVQLANGCLCCSVKSDLIDTFRDLTIQRQAGTLPNFSRVVIETTGIADPIPVLQIVLTNPMVRNAYALDGVVTAVDAVNGGTTLASFPESVKQVAVADRLVLTKGDLVDPGSQASLDALRATLRAINPIAPILAVKDGVVDPALLLGEGLFGSGDRRWLDPAAYQRAEATGIAATANALGDREIAAAYQRQHHSGDAGAGRSHQDPAHQNPGHHNHGDDIRSFCLTREDPVSLNTLQLFVDAIAREAGPNLLRVKGLVNVAEEPGRPAVIQGAQQIIHSLDWLPAWPTDDRRTRMVFITRGIDQAHIEDAFALIERIALRTARAAGRAF
jgi:G3E family GTPase